MLLGGLTLALAATTLVASLYSLTLIGPVDVGRVIPAAVSAWDLFCVHPKRYFRRIHDCASSLGGRWYRLCSLLRHGSCGTAGLNRGRTVASVPLISNINIFLAAQALDVATRLLKPGAVVLLLSTLF